MVGDMSRPITVYVLDLLMRLFEEVFAMLPLFVSRIALSVLVDIHSKLVIQPVLIFICLHGPAGLQNYSRDF